MNDERGMLKELRHSSFLVRYSSFFPLPPCARWCFSRVPLPVTSIRPILGLLWPASRLIVRENRLYVYYGATEGIHKLVWDTRAKKMKQVGLDKVINSAKGWYPFNGGLCRAGWRFDRLYALAPAGGGSFVGAAITTQRELGGKGLCINFRAKPPLDDAPGFGQGYVQAEILDKDNKPVAGFTRQDCQRLSGDHSALQVRWTGGIKIPPNGAKIKFYLKRAFLYGFAAK